MGPPHEGSIRRPIAPWANALPLSYVPLPLSNKLHACLILYLGRWFRRTLIHFSKLYIYMCVWCYKSNDRALPSIISWRWMVFSIHRRAYCACLYRVHMFVFLATLARNGLCLLSGPEKASLMLFPLPQWYHLQFYSRIYRPHIQCSFVHSI